MSAGFAGLRVVGLGDLSIDVFQKVQDKIYSSILFLIDYIAYGLHLGYKIRSSKEIYRNPGNLRPLLKGDILKN